MQCSIELPQRDGAYLVSIYTENESGDMFQGKFVLKVGTGKAQTGVLEFPRHEEHWQEMDCRLIITKEDSVPLERGTAWLPDLNTFALIPWEDAVDPKPLDVPESFDLTIVCPKQNDTFSFSKKGVEYNGKLYYPAERVLVQQFLKEIHLYLDWDYVYLRDVMGFDFEDVVSIDFTRMSVFGVEERRLETPQEIANELETMAFSQWVVHLFTPEEQPLPTDDVFASRWIFTLHNGETYTLREEWEYYALLAPDGEGFTFSKF